MTELLGASDRPLRIAGRVSRASVKLDAGVRRKTVRSLAMAATTAAPDNVYLKVENVRGTFDAAVLSVYDQPARKKLTFATSGSDICAGNVALFGLRRASMKDGQHAGEGLTLYPRCDARHRRAAPEDIRIGCRRRLSVSVIPSGPLPEKADITVGRISIYREGF